MPSGKIIAKICIRNKSGCISCFVQSYYQRCESSISLGTKAWSGLVRAALSSGQTVCRTLQTLQLRKDFATCGKQQVTILVEKHLLTHLYVSTWEHLLCSAGTGFPGAVNYSAPSDCPTGILSQKSLTASILSWTNRHRHALYTDFFPLPLVKTMAW